MALGGKMQAYAEARAEGLDPIAAGTHAGYSGAGLRVTVSRHESRADVQAEIKRLKRGGKTDRKRERGEEDEADLGKWAMEPHYDSPLDLLLDVMNNPKAPTSIRYAAAKDALPYCHPRKESGKKDEREKEAKRAAQGKFRTQSRPSRLQ